MTTKNGEVNYYYRDKAGCHRLPPYISLNTTDQICLEGLVHAVAPSTHFRTRQPRGRSCFALDVGAQGILTYVPMEDAIKALQ